MMRSRKAISQTMAMVIAVIVIGAAVAGYYLLYMQPSPTPTPTPTPSPQVRVLRSTHPLPFYIDPSVGTDGASTTAQYNLYDALIRIDWDNKVIPWLAEKWSYSSDGLTYTFIIKKDVKFHDGSEMTVDDVVWSMKRFITLGTGNAYVITPFVQDATAINSTAVQLKLKSSFGPFVSSLTRFYILNKDLVLQHLKPGQYGDMGDYGQEWLTANDAGSGAYKVRSYILGEKLVMEKHKDYFAGFLEKSPDIVEMIGTTEAMTVRTMLANKELEVSDVWQAIENLREIKKIPGIYIAATAETSYGWYLMMNTMKAPLDDVHVRRALAYAFDYDKLITTLFPDTIQMRGPVNTQLLGFNPDLFQFTRDIEKAKAELALSKYAMNITKYEISLHWCAEVPDEEKGAMLFMTNAAEIGIQINVVKTPWTTMVQESSSLETKPHIQYTSAGATFPEAGSVMINKYHSNNVFSWMQNECLMNKTLDGLLEDALRTQDFDQRMQKYKQIQNDLVNICPSIFMFQGIMWTAYPDYVTSPDVKYGKFEKVGELGNIYSVWGTGGGYRLFEVDRLITYAEK